METLNHYEGEQTMIKINPIIGNFKLKRRRLRLIRRGKLDLLQREVAEILGVSTATYGAWEIGLRSPSLGNFMKLVKLFGNDIYEEIKTPEATTPEEADKEESA